MYAHRKILAVIPARGGSKRLPGKNIRMFLGKPLIAWTIVQAKASRYIDRVVVSTDSPRIAGVARAYGAQVPFRRPAGLSTAAASSVAVLLHAVDTLEKRGEKFDAAVLLQPTSPLRNADDIDRSIRLFYRRGAAAVVTVSPAQHHPGLTGALAAGGLMRGFAAKNKRPAASGGKKFWRINGAVYVGRIPFLRKQGSFLGRKTLAMVMPQERSVDIDTLVDFEYALFLKKHASSSGRRG